MNMDLWRQYFAAAISAAALLERHSAPGMALRAAEIADAMMEVDQARVPAPVKPEPTRVPNEGTSHAQAEGPWVGSAMHFAGQIRGTADVDEAQD